MFEPRVVRAMYGDCQLVVYGQPEELHYILIDGGPATVYANHLCPVLADIAANGGRLERVVLTHTDDDHATGPVDLFADLRSRQLHGLPPVIPVDRAWMNSFDLDAAVAPSMADIVIPLPPSGLQPDRAADHVEVLPASASPRR